MLISTIMMMKQLQREYDNQANPAYEDEGIEPDDYDLEIEELNFDNEG